MNILLMRKVLDEDRMKPEILPHSSVVKRGYVSEVDLAGDFSTRSLQVEPPFPVTHNEGKVKRTSLCFLCSYVKMDVIMSKHEG